MNAHFVAALKEEMSHVRGSACLKTGGVFVFGRAVWRRRCCGEKLSKDVLWKVEQEWKVSGGGIWFGGEGDRRTGGASAWCGLTTSGW